MAVRYYTALFDGSLGFAPAATFTSYPGIFGLSIPDTAAEEAFTVYDHPRVRIFRKTAGYTRERTRRALSIDFGAVVPVSARDAPRAPNAPTAARERRVGGSRPHSERAPSRSSSPSRRRP